MIYQWYEKEDGTPLHNGGQFPSKMENLRKYFGNIYTPNERSAWTCYTKVCVGSNKDLREIITSNKDSDMAGYYIQQGGGCYNKPLDNATNPKYLGYLQGSSNFSKLEDIQKIFDNKLKEIGINKEVGVRFKK